MRKEQEWKRQVEMDLKDLKDILSFVECLKEVSIKNKYSEKLFEIADELKEILEKESFINQASLLKIRNILLQFKDALYEQIFTLNEASFFKAKIAGHILKLEVNIAEGSILSRRSIEDRINEKDLEKIIRDQSEFFRARPLKAYVAEYIRKLGESIIKAATKAEYLKKLQTFKKFTITEELLYLREFSWQIDDLKFYEISSILSEELEQEIEKNNLENSKFSSKFLRSIREVQEYIAENFIVPNFPLKSRDAENFIKNEFNITEILQESKNFVSREGEVNIKLPRNNEEIKITLTLKDIYEILQSNKNALSKIREIALRLKMAIVSEYDEVDKVKKKGCIEFFKRCIFREKPIILDEYLRIYRQILSRFYPNEISIDSGLVNINCLEVPENGEIDDKNDSRIFLNQL